MKYALSALFAFFMGSIPFAYIVGRVSKHIDIRDYGSKNPGAGNVFHLISIKAGFVALTGDLLKGVVALVLPYYLYKFSPAVLTVIGFCAVLGHVYSPFLGFRGGKGAATTAGVFLFVVFASFPFSEALILLAVLVAIWILLLLITHSQVVSLAVILPIFAFLIYLFSNSLYFFLAVLLFTIVEELFGLSSLRKEWKASYEKYLKKLLRRS
ncbi:MAG: glycerol-3-phosphate acyltransferase [Caldisericaceae bacterium]